MNIRPLTEEDLPSLLEIRNECREMLHDNREFTLDQTKIWFSNLSDNHKYWAIWDGSNNKLAGYFRLKYLGNFPKTVEIGMDLHKNYRGKGLAVVCYKQFFDILKESNIQRLKLKVLSTNQVAFNLYLKLGFQCVGAEAVPRGDRFIPSIDMQLDIQRIDYEVVWI